MTRNPYDGSPEYTEPIYALGDLEGVVICTECGALVWARRVHTNWHRSVWNEA